MALSDLNAAGGVLAVRHDLGALFADLGLRPVGAERAHMSKVMTFDRP